MTDCSPRRAFETEGAGSNGASSDDGTDALGPPVDDGIVVPPPVQAESPPSIASVEMPSVRAEGDGQTTPVVREARDKTAEVSTDRNGGDAGDAAADGAKSAGTNNEDDDDASSKGGAVVVRAPSTTATKSSSPDRAAVETASSTRLSPRRPPVPEAGSSSSAAVAADDEDDDHGGLVLDVDLAVPPPMPAGPLPSIASSVRRTSASSGRNNQGDGGSGVVLPGAHAISYAAYGGNANANADAAAADDDDEGSRRRSGDASALPAVSVATLVQDGVVVDAAAVDLEAEAAERDRLRREIEALEREEKDRDGHSWQRRCPFWVALGAVAVVAAIVAASVAAGILVPRGRGGEAGDESSSKEETTRYEDLRTIVAPLGREEDNDTFDDVDSPRSKALDWIARIDPLRLPLDDPDREWKVRQRYVLALLYFSTDGEDWDLGANFVTDQDECRWFDILEGWSENEFYPMGVRCDDRGRVDAIHIWWNNMSGTIPPELSYLADSLEELSFTGNAVSGTIPPELGKLAKLRQLFLLENCLSGDVPESLFELSNLEQATLAGNSDLSGSLNGFCDGNKYRGNLNHMVANCDSCPISPALIECDCCICCDIVTYNCCDRQGNRLWNHANIDVNAAGNLFSFDRPCLAEETRTYYDANKDDLSWITDGRGNNFL